MSNTGDPQPDDTPQSTPPADTKSAGAQAADTKSAGAQAAGARSADTNSAGAVRDEAVRGDAAPEDALLEGEQIAGDDTVTIHRSPRYFRFMAAGAVLGVVIAVVLTFAFPEPPGFNPAQIFGFLGILFVIVGVAAGAVVALLIDRASRRRARTIAVERIESAPTE